MKFCLKSLLVKKKYVPMVKKTQEEQTSTHVDLVSRCEAQEEKLSALLTRIQSLEESFDTLKNRLNRVITLDELPPSKAQKTAGSGNYNRKGAATSRPKILQ
jgi:hypothetical protein